MGRRILAVEVEALKAYEGPGIPYGRANVCAQSCCRSLESMSGSLSLFFPNTVDEIHFDLVCPVVHGGVVSFAKYTR